VDYEWGDGPEVSGPGEALFMTMLGRHQPLDELDGEGMPSFRSRVLASGSS
jgi:hypothetical protein